MAEPLSTFQLMMDWVNNNLDQFHINVANYVNANYPGNDVQPDQLSGWGRPDNAPYNPTLKLSGFKFDIVNAKYDESIINTDHLDNSDSGTELTSSFTCKTTTTDSYTFQLGVELSVGTEVTFEVGVPWVTNAEATVSAEFKTNMSQSWTKTIEKSWEKTISLTVQAGHCVDATGLIRHGLFDVSYQAQGSLDGTIIVAIPRGSGQYDHVDVPLGVAITLTVPITGTLKAAAGVSTVIRTAPCKAQAPSL